MNNLNTIEIEFLSAPEVRNFIPINTIQNLSQQIGDAKKSKFEKSLKLAKIVNKANDWYKSEEAKNLMNTEGVDWVNVESFRVEKILFFQNG